MLWYVANLQYIFHLNHLINSNLIWTYNEFCPKCTRLYIPVLKACSHSTILTVISLWHSIVHTVQLRQRHKTPYNLLVAINKSQSQLYHVTRTQLSSGSRTRPRQFGGHIFLDLLLQSWWRGYCSLSMDLFIAPVSLLWVSYTIICLPLLSFVLHVSLLSLYVFSALCVALSSLGLFLSVSVNFCSFAFVVHIFVSLPLRC